MNNLSITEYLKQDQISDNIRGVLKERTPQFITSVVSLVNSNSAFLNVDRKSILNACLIAASLDLPINPNLGIAYVIPYAGKAQFQMGYKGFIQLAQRSGQFAKINAGEVKDTELIEIDYYSGEPVFKRAENRETLKTIGYFAYFELKNGFHKTLYMTTAELSKHGKKFSQSFKKGYGLWEDEFDVMAKKTVIKLLLSKYAPLTTEMAKAQEADQAIVNEDGFEYADNKKLSPEETARLKEKNRLLLHIDESETLDELEQCVEAVQQFGDEEVSAKYDSKLIQLGDKVS